MRLLWTLPSTLIIAFGLIGCAEQPEKAAEPAKPATTATTTTPAEPAKPAEVLKAEPNAAENLPTAPKDGEEVAVIDTAKGKIIVMFYDKVAPNHVKNFKDLANEKFYDGTRFHRCIPGFMIQGGDPFTKDVKFAQQWGTGGKMVDGRERNVMAEFSTVKHVKGTLSMARSQDPNSASSQFFLMHDASPQLDGQYSAFGKIVTGQEVVDEIVKTGDAGNNGAVKPEEAVLVRSIRIEKWPVK